MSNLSESSTKQLKENSLIYREYRQKLREENEELFLKNNAEKMRAWRLKNKENCDIWNSKEFVKYLSECKGKTLFEDSLSNYDWYQLLTNECYYCGSVPEEGYNVFDIPSAEDKQLIQENIITSCKVCKSMKIDTSSLKFIQRCQHISAFHGCDGILDYSIWDNLTVTYCYSKYITICKTKNIVFSIDKDVFQSLIKSNCYCCDKSYNIKQIEPNKNRLSTKNLIDGYTPENTITVCNNCYNMKLSMDIDSFIGQCKKVSKQFINNFLSDNKVIEQVNKVDKNEIIALKQKELVIYPEEGRYKVLDSKILGVCTRKYTKYEYILSESNNDEPKYVAIYWDELEYPIVYDYKFYEDFSRFNFSISQYPQLSSPGDDDKRHYMHDMVMKRINPNHVPVINVLSTDHINCKKNDNRSENLRLATISQQNSNRGMRSNRQDAHEEIRKQKGIDHYPPHIRLSKSEQKFVIEKTHPYFKRHGIKGYTGTKSKDYKLLDRYEQIIAKLAEFDKLEEDEIRNNNESTEFKDKKKRLNDEYLKITNLIRSIHNKEPIEEIVDEFKQVPVENPVKIAPGRKKASRLPPGCGVRDEDIPKYVTFKEGDDEQVKDKLEEESITNKKDNKNKYTRGHQFIFERRIGSKRLLKRSTSSVYVPTLVKFKYILENYDSFMEEAENM